MDLHIGTIGINSAALEVVHVPPRDIEKFQEHSADHHLSTYVVSGIGDEGRIMDGKSSILNVDCSSVLKVVCGPPGIGETSGNFCKRRSWNLPVPLYSR